MVEKNVIKEIEELFNIKNNSSSDDDITMGEEPIANKSQKSFDSLAQEVSSSVDGLEQKGQAIEPKQKEVKQDRDKDLITRSIAEAKAKSEEKKEEVAIESPVEEYDGISVEEISPKSEVMILNPEAQTIIGESVILINPEVEKPVEEVKVNSDDDFFNQILKPKEEKVVVVEPSPELTKKIETDVVKPVVEEVKPTDGDVIEFTPSDTHKEEVSDDLPHANDSLVNDSYEKLTKKDYDTGWKLKSPGRIYDEFYKIKRKYVCLISGNGQLNFEKLTADLIDCHVDISTEILDKTILFDKQDRLFQCYERVRQLEIQMANEYFGWKRFVEIIRGTLARAQYLKPVSKQAGLEEEHMGDIELYFTSIEALRKKVDTTKETLDKAYENINRKISVMLDANAKNSDTMTRMKPMVDSRPLNNNKLEHYDNVSVGDTVEGKTKNGMIDWGQIG